jgi:hypothetical protein
MCYGTSDSCEHLFSFSLVSVYRVNWMVWTDFGYEFHILKQEKMSVSTCLKTFNLWVTVDFLAQENFCWWFVQWCAVHFFVCSVLLRDETCFGRWHHQYNQHQWAEKNPHGVIRSRHQQQFIINVWIGGDCFVGQHICHISLQATTIKVSSYTNIQNYWKMYHWQSEHKCGRCMMVLHLILAVLCNMFSIKLRLMAM